MNINQEMCNNKLQPKKRRIKNERRCGLVQKLYHFFLLILNNILNKLTEPILHLIRLETIGVY